MKNFLFSFCFCLHAGIFLCISFSTFSHPLDFTTVHLGKTTPVVLVVGGIQGDEPGGFSAATLIATRYSVKNGTVWVVPNLNFPSIIKRSRGLNGDMNRKFAALGERDPDFSTVRRIQDIIRRPEVGLVLNLHDGSGYYREKKINSLCSPSRWGQSVIIDQVQLEAGAFMGNLEQEARQVVEDVNQLLIHKMDTLHIRNTNTALGDREMEKSLSYYAVRHGKAAFGLEASKEFPVELRVYYHLCMVESLLRQAGILFVRNFELTPESIRQVLQTNIGISFAEKRITLPLDNVRPTLAGWLPLPKNLKAETTKPIIAVLPCKKNSANLCIHYGNRTLTHVKPEWREMDDSLSAVRVTVDGQEKFISFGEVLPVAESLYIHPHEGFRINAIGSPSKTGDNTGTVLRRKNFLNNYSLDRQGTLYRIEVYKNKQFTGMFLARFNNTSKTIKNDALLPSIPGPESNSGF